MKIIAITGLLITLCLIGNAQTAKDSNQTRLRGRVVDLTGRPLTGTRVTLAFADKQRFETKTDEKGEYVFRALPSGNTDLSVEEIGFYKYKTTLYLNIGEETIFDLGLHAGLVTDAPDLTVKGSVRNGNTKAIEDVTIIARSVFNSNVFVSSKTSKNGTFKLQLPSYGQYFVYTTSPGKKTDVRLININTEKTYMVDLVLLDAGQ